MNIRIQKTGKPWWRCCTHASGRTAKEFPWKCALAVIVKLLSAGFLSPEGTWLMMQKKCCETQ